MDSTPLETDYLVIGTGATAMAFVDTFQDLGGLRQLPGIGAQRLMADGYGFGAEGDWKSSMLVRIVKAVPCSPFMIEYGPVSVNSALGTQKLSLALNT